MEIRGGSPEHLRELAATLEREAQALEQAARRLEREFSAVPWKSRTSERLLGEWEQHRQQLLRTASYFTEVARAARSSADTLGSLL